MEYGEYVSGMRHSHAMVRMLVVVTASAEAAMPWVVIAGKINSKKRNALRNQMPRGISNLKGKRFNRKNVMRNEKMTIRNGLIEKNPNTAATIVVQAEKMRKKSNTKSSQWFGVLNALTMGK